MKNDVNGNLRVGSVLKIFLKKWKNPILEKKYFSRAQYGHEKSNKSVEDRDGTIVGRSSMVYR